MTHHLKGPHQMAEPIRGRVAKVLNTRELLFNRGSDDGVRVGMHFAVLDPQAENVKDPETGQVLGSISRPKVTVEVSQVEPQLSLAATYRKIRTNTGGSGGLGVGLGKLFEPPNWEERYETFKSSERTWEALPEAQSYVKTGDPIVQITSTSTATGLAGAEIRSRRGGDARSPTTPEPARGKPRGASGRGRCPFRPLPG